MKFLRRPRFADVISLLALFVALGGTGYAAALAANSVGSREIRTGAVGTSEVRTGGVGKSELRTGSVGKSEAGTGSVGKSEIAANGVGAAEIRKDAVDTTELKDGGVALDDIAPAARTALTEAGAVTFRTAVTSTGTSGGGSAKTISHTAPGEYTIDLGRDVSACQYAATLAGVRNGTTVEAPKPGFITATPGTGAATVRISIQDPQGTAQDAPFHLLVAC